MPKEFIVTKPNTIEFREYAEKALEPNQVRIRSLVSGIKTGTEMALYHGATPFLNNRFDPEYRLFMPAEKNALYPCNLGSWLAGEVIETGRAVKSLRVGDLVHGGMPHRPTNVMAEDEVYPVRKGTNLETELFTDPAIFALQSVHDAEIKVGDNVAIFGMGALGLLAVQIARLSGAENVYAIDTIPARLELAVTYGASAVLNARDCDAGFEIKKLTGKKGVDVAIEISGSYAALQQAIRCVHREGLIVAASYYKGDEPLQLGAEWHHNRYTLRSSMAVWGCNHRNHPMWDLKRVERTAIHLLESGKLITEGMVTQRFDYGDAAAAYALLDEHIEDTIKVLLDYPTGN